MVAAANMETNPLFASPLVAAVVAVGSLSIILWIVKAARNAASGKRKRKHPPKAPLGIIDTVRMLSSPDLPLRYLELFRGMRSSVVRLSLPLPGHPMVVAVADADASRRIFTDPLTEKPAAVYGRIVEMSPTRTKSMFMLTGEPWHARRKGALPAFSSKHVRRMNTVALEATESWIRNRLLPAIDRNESFDIGEEMLRTVFVTFSKTALEYDISDEEMTMFMHESDLAHEEFLLKSVTNPFRKYFWWMLPKRKRAMEAIRRNVSFIMKVIESYRKLREPTEGTIINRIMTNPVFANDDERIAELRMYIVGGHDTTANTLAWTLLELAKRPEEQERLRESLRKLPREEWGRSDALRTVIKEGMRLNPVNAAGVTRSIGCDMVISREGYDLPKNTVAMMANLALCRSTDIYGDDADIFRPSRWDRPTKEMVDAFMPFALGKNNCIGQSLANAELHCILARIVCEFEFSVEDEGRAEHFLMWKPVGARLRARKA